MHIGTSLNEWKQATRRLPWGAQHVMHDTLVLASEGKVSIVYGADYRDGHACLVNSVGQMLKVGGGHGIPSNHFGEVVALFDSINRHFENLPGYNETPGLMSPGTAEILVHHFSELKEKPKDEPKVEINSIFVEPSDADLAVDWLLAAQQRYNREVETDEAPANKPLG